MLSHVKLPEGLNIQLLFRKQRQDTYWLRDSHVSSPKFNFPEQIFPGRHAYGGSYTRLEIECEGQRATVETATDGKDFYLLYRPLESPALPYILAVETDSTVWARTQVQGRMGSRRASSSEMDGCLA